MIGFGGKLGMGEKTQRIEPMVERDDDDAARGETRAVVARLGPGAGDEPAAVNPDHCRQSCAIAGRGRRPDIEIEAILGHAGGVTVDVAPDDALQRIGPEGVRRAARRSMPEPAEAAASATARAAARHRECPCKRERRRASGSGIASAPPSIERLFAVIRRHPEPVRLVSAPAGASAFRRARRSAPSGRALPRSAAPRSISPSVPSARTSRPSVGRRPSRSPDERSMYPRSRPNAPRRSCRSLSGALRRSAALASLTVPA